jgi:hypothetical protein
MNSVRAVAVLVVALSSGVIPASAQTPRPERPYRGLFGSGVDNAEQLLTFGATIGGGYDDSIPVEALEADDSSQQRYEGGWFTQGGLTLRYLLERQRVAFGASVATLGRYYPADLKEVVGTHSASVGLAARVARRTQVHVNQSISRQPYFVISMFPVLFEPEIGQVAIPTFEFSTRRERYFTYTTAAGIVQTLSRRATLRGNYNYSGTEFSSLRNRFVVTGADGEFTYGLNKNLDFRARYGFLEGRYGTNVRRSQLFDVGLDFRRALSLSRRTTLSFATGSAAINYGDRTHYRLTGSARLRREIGRTWDASIAYDRTLGFVETLQEPIFADAVHVGVNGLMNRRVSLRAAAGASRGNLGFTGTDRGFSSLFATASAQTALTRRLELGVHYSFYRHAFDSAAFLPLGLPVNLDRQTVRAYLTVWQPLFYRARRPPDASR